MLNFFPDYDLWFELVGNNQKINNLQRNIPICHHFHSYVYMWFVGLLNAGVSLLKIICISIFLQVTNRK